VVFEWFIVGATYIGLTDEQRKALVFISISLNPECDSPETSRAFAGQFGIGAEGCTFLTRDSEHTERKLYSMDVMSYSEDNHRLKIHVVKNKGKSISAVDNNKADLLTAILPNMALADSQ
jgi:cytochrome oxidase Cu insertion factor (SCO1/SenC/PrrC family)